MSYTITQQRALGDLARYTNAQEAREAALRLNAYSPRLDPDQMYRDIREIMIHTAGRDGSIHNAHLPLLDFAKLPGRRSNPLHAAAMRRACWGEWKDGLTRSHESAGTVPDNTNQWALEFARRMRPTQIESPRELLSNGEDGDERDRDFFDALPDEFVVWRGVSDIDLDTAAKGMSFTTHEGVARWFAFRNGGDPLVIRATVRKSDVFTVFAYDHEVVVRPTSVEVVEVGCSEARAYPKDSEWNGGPAIVTTEGVTAS